MSQPAAEKSGASAFTRRMRIALRGLGAAYRAVVTSVHPSTDKAWLAEAQLRLHRNGSRTTLLTMPVAAFLISWAFQPWVAFERRAGWWIGMTVLCVLLDQGNRRIDRMPGRNAKAIARKSQYATAISVVFLAAWCSMSVCLWAPDVPMAHMLLVLILACSMAGTLVACASHPAIAVAALVIHAIFLIGPPAFGGTELDTILALLSAVFTVLMSGQLISLTMGVNRLLALEHERTGLLHSMRAAKQDSDRDRARAVSAGKAKSQFLSHMNHELRTPMNAVLGFSDLIRQKAFGNDVEKYAEYAGIIHDSGNHLLSLIDDMLDLAKIEGGKLTLRETVVDLPGLIGDAIDNNAEAAQKRHIVLTGDVAAGLPDIFADERALHQIVANLLSNALKYTQAQGHVIVFARCAPDGRAAFGVEDTGIGIAPEDQDHVFERFGTGRSDVAKAQKGTGLGLAIVKGFAEAHDGTVVLDSQLGGGTRVTIYLPRERVLMTETRLTA